jgi:hypothetical protein
LRGRIKIAGMLRNLLAREFTYKKTLTLRKSHVSVLNRVVFYSKVEQDFSTMAAATPIIDFLPSDITLH